MASIPSSYERIFGGGQTGGSSRLVASLVTPRFSSLEEAAVVAPAGTNRSRSPFGLSRRRVLSARRESPICLSPTTSNRELFGKGFSRHQPPPIVNPSVTTARVRSQSQGARRMKEDSNTSGLILFPASKVSVVPFVPPEPLRRRAHLAWPELSLTREPQSPWDDGSPRLNPNGVYPRSGNERDWLRKSGYTQRLHSARAEMMSCAGSGKLPSTQMHVPKNSPLLVKDTMQLNGELSREEMFASK
ncbi:hypothetical protein FOZ62_005403 [Perkinsus olseni]|uniref:Uncharacterized protein n=1 Tax=Perkinsus olseni TaxID=32597 RepID=A0A7J6RPX6_PEROL|nr:hypothetical protein FOZ62_005403 [Perkinsus olseni]